MLQRREAPLVERQQIFKNLYRCIPLLPLSPSGCIPVVTLYPLWLILRMERVGKTGEMPSLEWSWGTSRDRELFSLERPISASSVVGGTSYDRVFVCGG